jgi:hypothetical protein
MLRVTLRGSGVPTVVVGSGETVAFGRQVPGVAPGNPQADLRRHAVDLPQCAPHVSRLVGELVVGEDVVRLRWRGTTEGTLSSLFEAPGGARRVTLAGGMTALLDEGENQILLLRGRAAGTDGYTDVLLSVTVELAGDDPEPFTEASDPVDRDGEVTGPAPALTPHSREWFVALALAEPWLTGADDYPRPPSNREIYERVLGWHGYAWNLARSQRVDDALRVIARLAFGPHDDPFTAPADGRAQNVRFAIGRRAAEIRLVTAEELGQVEQQARARGQGGTFR